MQRESKLHEYDLRLCDYVRANVLPLESDLKYVAALKEGLALPLFEYLADERNNSASMQQTLLSRDELTDLESALDELSHRHKPIWLPYEALHRDYTATVPEVRELLAKRTAEQWAERCHRFAEILESPRLSVRDGIGHVSEWLTELRRNISAIGRKDLLPAPKGGFPTPTFPDPDKLQSAQEHDEKWESDVDTVRATLEKLGKDTKVQVVRNDAGMNNQRCRNILRYLQDNGEYTGYDRKQRPASR